ncbi:uncharacterized protein L969DRAFT_103473 [Mixia osmundae IAM 14324]|uniref:5'-3' DNA helicase ZGRF1-like N-terminal domain-containing protein n=1 Tax=Mixia osmundae (strain CBS 9802 / IAM 14324 / JCM 22182 / KY 12970) TaxID=764103 RepID=G7DVZ0_MIXOS|nr:uncharacterized protein L969DRAFT_103473 [Mixia osmundae IAM 14324]KEI39568.1 hypothetical protein L969DRAFT_103473 [Mixia osmundae IAM 14324]GAA94750.1 hypothetical protein E5Q_01404 [Mixia osmundae IAM 14324]
MSNSARELSTRGSDCADTAVVKRYAAQYTSDVHKKAKTWHDGYVRVHHYNAKAFLLDSAFGVIDETTVPRYIYASAGRAQASSCVAPTITFAPDTEIQFSRHLSRLEDFCLESKTDLNAIKETHSARKRKVAADLDGFCDDANPSSPAAVQKKVASPYASVIATHGSPALRRKLSDRASNASPRPPDEQRRVPMLKPRQNALGIVKLKESNDKLPERGSATPQPGELGSSMTSALARALQYQPSHKSPSGSLYSYQRNASVVKPFKAPSRST